ncbi:hypothetical protein A2164_00565, partial [Candidatus Curtissbacteria bacterium RBG_13_35_7]
MITIPNDYLEVLKRRDFFILSLVIFLGQLASSFLILALIVSVFSKTGSNFGVSGVILSFTVPAFFMMAFAGVVADIFDRRKLILGANSLITVVGFIILFKYQYVSASIPLAFLYFAGNSFFIPASSAATAQLVKKCQLLTANSIFMFMITSALILGFFLASMVNFIFGILTTLAVTNAILVLAVVLSYLLPSLKPVRVNHPSVVKNIRSIISGFTFIIRRRVILYFFLMFALMQAITFFGVTLAPGFFNEVVGISIDKSPILVFPLIGLGILAGVGFINKPEMSEGFLVALGLSIVGIASTVLGLLIKFNIIVGNLLYFIPIYLFLIGFGTIITMIASRTMLQKEVPHAHLGIVFGANMILVSFLSAFLSPFGAFIELLLGYINILIYGGL